ncbi:hypothetical protein UA08_04042 [Talaromyces atroroseus]|uniref:Aminoglycoside phosphotransferase domain-containing protein n=1 Tax=Talaromyces atroroseus TaxID=1441469 RepID=A0A1Q5Q9A0_TALAT|nr:hypothetical protein UA08_04042 [Talaromyces atroroseus]OKL60599.1 hypothetical protein UA08_04042 [Talaromyces atroroseus]
MRLPSLEFSGGDFLGKASHDINFSASVSAGYAISENSRFENVVQLLFPHTVQLRTTHRLSADVHRIYQLDLSNGYQLVVKFSPPPALPLLRREQLSLETEAHALTILAQLGHPCIPRLFRYMPCDPSSSASFLVRQYINGTLLPEMRSQLSPGDCRNLDRHLGSLVRAISQQVSTSFGSLGQAAAGTGSSSWRESFISLFEEVLRDAEDMMIHLPYDQIRREISRLGPALDEITVPRLVVVNFGRPSDVLLDPNLKQLSGILDLGSAIWGDVLMAEMFEAPSDAFLAGFGPIPSSGRYQSMRSML